MILELRGEFDRQLGRRTWSWCYIGCDESAQVVPYEHIKRIIDSKCYQIQYCRQAWAQRRDASHGSIGRKREEERDECSCSSYMSKICLSDQKMKRLWITHRRGELPVHGSTTPVQGWSRDYSGLWGCTHALDKDEVWACIKPRGYITVFRRINTYWVSGIDDH